MKPDAVADGARSGQRILAFGTWDRGPGYPRAEALFAALRRQGHTVVECRIELPYGGAEKRRLLRSPWLWPHFAWSKWRGRQRAQRALRSALAADPADLVLVPYPGHLAVSWARQVWTGPVVLDLFLSAYDTAVVDRKMFRPDSFMGQWLRRLDSNACRSANRILVDTDLNAEALSGLVNLPRQAFSTVGIADSREPSAPVPYAPPRSGETVRVLFFGTGVPLHGLRTLIDAVARVDGIELTLIGGSTEDRCRARAVGGEKIRLLDEFVAAGALRAHLESTHLVAGVFGTSAKADRVVPFKVMHALSIGRPVITARSRGACSVFRDGIDGVLVPPGDVEALAAALERIVAAPAALANLAGAARVVFERRFSLDATGRQLSAACAAVTDGAEGNPAVPLPRPIPESVAL